VTVLFVVLPIAVLVSSLSVLAFVWAARGGQLDDLETPPLRVLCDDLPVGTSEVIVCDDASR
jgi:cbb3-type cytochrome oxidase maturation protein